MFSAQDVREVDSTTVLRVFLVVVLTDFLNFLHKFCDNGWCADKFLNFLLKFCDNGWRRTLP